MGGVAVIREGTGPEVLLVHGGASPQTTWRGLEPLCARWTLASVHRRGYPPSPPGRHDFDVDANDLEPLLDARPHVVAQARIGFSGQSASTAGPARLGTSEEAALAMVPGDCSRGRSSPTLRVMSAERFVPVRLARVVLRDGAEQQWIFLQEVDGQRGFPIVIGTSEASVAFS